MPRQLTNIVIKVNMNEGILRSGRIGNELGSSVRIVDRFESGNKKIDTINNSNIRPPTIRYGISKPLNK